MIKEILLISILSVLLLHQANATEQYCKDNETLVKNITFTFCSNGKCTEYIKTEEFKCEYGCDLERNRCIPSPAMRYAIIIAIIFLIIIAFFAIRWFI